MIFGDSTSSKREMQGKVAGHLALSAVLALSAFLDLSRLTSEGYANLYYAATVKDMLTSWHNFFFASYDAGFVSVDKPPLGFWIQATSAYLFGFHGWSILLPQALAGILSVALLYHLLSRSFGPVYANRLYERASPRQHCRTLRQDTTIPWLVSGCCAAR
jgi:4-amino-4-deoxy-L-arabinose transferase-like glycosyltransferase